MRHLTDSDNSIELRSERVGRKVMKKLGVGIIGVGAIGRLHAENLAKNIPNVTLVGIADSFVSAANEMGKKLGIDKIYADYHEMLDNKDVEAIVIAAPTFLKKDMVASAARKGKHIFVEKPMALTVKDCEDMIGEAKRAGIKLQVGYQRRFDHAFVKIEKAITAGDLGKIMIVNSATRDPPANVQGWSIDPKLSGGIWLDTCSHDFDAIRYLSRSEVTEVYAEAVNIVYDQLKPLGGFDTVLVTLTLSNGALAHVDSCQYTVYGYDVRAEVFGTKAVAFVGMGHNSGARIIRSDNLSEDLPMTFQERFGQAYRDELVDFADCVLSNRTPKVQGEDGLKAVEIGLACAESVQRHAPVKI
ncbi:MAG: Gfo/Idh/MocA family oxidoreductase [Thaumarchaeota archaeon]|nr:Gfo/Idh/MocA family oxidoreductase [Nitrososphaerota archaeon]